MNGQEKAVTVRNMEKRFGDFVAVDRVSFEVARGEIFGFPAVLLSGFTFPIANMPRIIRWLTT